MLGLSGKLKESQLNRYATWFDKNNRVFDTVVFIHGIAGHQIKTWGKFPRLLHTDEELPNLGILQWGYKSGFSPGRYNGIDTQSDRFRTSLEMAIKPSQSIYVVAHSMGGLISLKSIVDEIGSGRGDKHPTNSISLLTLIATPLEGSELARLIEDILSISIIVNILTTKYFVRKQLTILKDNSEFVNALTKKVRKYIKPVNVDSETSSNKITVQVVTGSDDTAVDRKSAGGAFSGGHSVMSLKGSHSSVKKPDHHFDDKYLCVKSNLVKKLAISLYEKTNRCSFSVNGEEDSLLEDSLFRQYKNQIDKCLQSIYKDRKPNEVEVDNVIRQYFHLASLSSNRDAQELVLMTVFKFRKFSDHI